jgi:hypothetical protein
MNNYANAVNTESPLIWKRAAVLQSNVPNVKGSLIKSFLNSLIILDKHNKDALPILEKRPIAEDHYRYFIEGKHSLA